MDLISMSEKDLSHIKTYVGKSGDQKKHRWGRWERYLNENVRWLGRMNGEIFGLWETSAD